MKEKLRELWGYQSWEETVSCHNISELGHV